MANAWRSSRTKALWLRRLDSWNG